MIETQIEEVDRMRARRGAGYDADQRVQHYSRLSAISETAYAMDY